MDEATVGRIVGIVKNMQAGGMSEKDIIDNLRQMGLSGEELNEVLNAVGMAESKPAEEPAPLLPEEHFERLHATVGELHDKQDELKSSFSEISELRRDIAAVKAELDEIRPLVGALKRINENLIEINKKMLTRLETR